MRGLSPPFGFTRPGLGSTISVEDLAWGIQRDEQEILGYEERRIWLEEDQPERPPHSLVPPVALQRTRLAPLHESTSPRRPMPSPLSRQLPLERYLWEENSHERRALGLVPSPMLSRASLADHLPTSLAENVRTLRPSGSIRDAIMAGSSGEDSDKPDKFHEAAMVELGRLTLSEAPKAGDGDCLFPMDDIELASCDMTIDCDQRAMIGLIPRRFQITGGYGPKSSVIQRGTS